MTAILQQDIPQGTTEKDPGIVASLLWILAFVVFQLVGIILSIVLHAAITGEPAMTMTKVNGNMVPVPNADAVVMMFGVFLGSAGIIALRAKYLCRHLKPAWDRNSEHAMSKKSIGITVLLVIGIAIFDAGYQMILGDVKIQPELILFLNAMNSGYAGLAIAFLAGSLGAPVMEEMLFRGQLQGSIQNKLDQKYSNAPVIAILITASVFALIHFQPLAIPPLFVAGAAFGWIRWRSGSLALPIMAHIAMNFLSLTMLYVTGEI